jgi:Rod binding domain-containing protein
MISQVVETHEVGQTSTPRSADSPAKVRDAAQQFEALLLSEILRSERQSGNGWLGSGEDTAGECATDYAEQQFCVLLGKQGGLGLARLIAAGLEKRH